MKHPPLLDALLLSSVLALGGYLALTAESPTSTEISLRAENILPTFSPESIIALRWEVPRSFTLSRSPEEKDPNRYFLDGADRRPADEETVRGLLRLLDLAIFKRTLGPGSHVDAGKLGFDKPALEMRIDAGPRSYRLVAGARAPAPANSVYLKVEGTNVETVIGVVDESFVSQLKKTEQEFLGGLVFPLARSETRSLKLTSKVGEVHLEPDEDDFYLKASAETRQAADRELVDLIFFQLARTKIHSYLDSPSKAPMPLRVEQIGNQGTAYVAELGAPCPSDPHSILVHRTSPTVLSGCTSLTVMAALLVERSRLVSSTVTSLNPDEIDHVVITSPDKSLDVLREGHAYKLLSRDNKLISQGAGDEFLKSLTTAKMTPLAAPPESAKPVGKVTIKGQARNTALSPQRDRTDHAVEVQLEIFEDEGGLYVHRKTDASWFSVAEYDQWLFLTDDAWTKERKLASFTPTDILRVQVTLPSGESWEIERDGEKLVLTDPPRRPADPALGRELFRTLAELAALRFESPSRPRPGTGTLKVTFDVKETGKAKTWNLWVGPRVRGGYLAWSDLTDGTFVLPLASRLPLELPLEDRRAFRVDVENLDLLIIETGARKVRFERQAGMLRAAGGEARDEMLEPLTEAFGSLRVVSAGGKHPEARRIQRGVPEWTLHVTTLKAGQERPKPVTLRIGGPAVWQGLSCRTSWIEGEPGNFFIEDASLAPLRELL